MNEYSKNDLIRYRLSRADETLNEVPDLLRLKYFSTAVNRLYYATFYAVIALLLKEKIKTTTHDGVRKMLGLHFISKGIISRELGKHFSQLFDKRQRGDYNDFFDFTEEDVWKLIPLTRKLVNEIKTLIEI